MKAELTDGRTRTDGLSITIKARRKDKVGRTDGRGGAGGNIATT